MPTDEHPSHKKPQMKGEEEVQIPQTPRPSRIALRFLNAYVFFSAIVRDGLGPFVAVYLVVARDWSPGEAGSIWMIREFAMLLAQTPMGDLFDKVSYKTYVLAGFTLISSLSSVIITFTDNWWAMVLRSIAGGIAASAIPPGIASICLGIAGPDQFDRYMARTEYWNHSGSLISAVAAGIVAYVLYPDVQYLFVAIGVTGAGGIISLLCIPTKVIDDDIARNLDKKIETAKAEELLEGTAPVSHLDVVRDCSVMMFAVSTFLFHLGNAAVLPLLGQMIALEKDREGLLLTGVLIIIAQATSIPAAYMVAKCSHITGYNFMVCVGYASIPLRCAAIVLTSEFASKNMWGLVATQILDGVGAGCFGLSHVLVTRALTEGTGRFNVAIGFMVASHGLGSALSNVIGGVLADESYNLAFIVLGGIACLPIFTVTFCVRESNKKKLATPADDPESESSRAEETTPMSLTRTMTGGLMEVADTRLTRQLTDHGSILSKARRKAGKVSFGQLSQTMHGLVRQLGPSKTQLKEENENLQKKVEELEQKVAELQLQIASASPKSYSVQPSSVLVAL